MLKASISGTTITSLPQWGRCFWQDPNDGNLFLAYASGNAEVDFIYSSNSGVTWSNPQLMFKVDNFSVYNNFDTFMDYEGHIHAGFRLNNSGCYQFFGKIGPNLGWTAASGRGTVQLNNAHANDNGVARGWQGSITRLEVASAFSAYSTFPRVLVTCKNAQGGVDIFSALRPFNGFLSRDATNTSTGAEYNWPILHNDTFAGGASVVWQSGNNILYREEFLGWSSIREGFGMLGWGTIPLGPNMAFGSGAGLRSNLVMSCASSGQELYGIVEDTSFNPVFKVLASGYIPNAINTIKNKFSNNQYGAYGDGGTLCDFTWKDNPAQHHLYYAGKNSIGTNCIQRVVGEHSRPKNAAQSTVWTFNSSHGISGIQNISPIDANLAGGIYAIGYWRGFKAAKHPISAGIKRNPLIDKGEFLVTSSYAPSIPSGSMLNIWEIKSDEIQPGLFPIPNFARDYTEDPLLFNKSPISNAIIASGGFTILQPSAYSGLFDRSLSTNIFLETGPSAASFAHITVKMTRPLHINKIEMTKTGSDAFGACIISGSIDNINWTRLGIQNPGQPLLSNDNKNVVYFTSDSSDSALAKLGNIESPVCQYLRIIWPSGGSLEGTALSTLRLFGPGSTKNIQSIDRGQTPGIPVAQRVLFATNPWEPQRSTNTERFVYQHDTAIPGFEHYGSFNWFVKASGEFTRTSELSSSLGNGLVPSGSWANTPYGAGDGFAAQIGPYSGTGSGVASARIRIDEGIRFFSLDYRTDLHNGDTFEVWTVAQTGVTSSAASTPVLRLRATGVNDYTNLSFNLENNGYHFLKLVQFNNGSTTPGRYGTSWVDNIIGLSIPQPSINSFLVGHAAFATGHINAYMNTNQSDYIYGFLTSTALPSFINAYLPSHAFINASGSIDAYMSGKGAYINGYCAGGDISSYLLPTGQIYGYIGVGSHVLGTSINAYLAESQLNSINGYLMSHETQFASGGSGNHIINGYLLAQKPVTSIYAALNPNANTSNENIHGYLKGKDGDQNIYGYLHMNSGIIDSRNAFMEGWSLTRPPQNIIWATMPGTTALGSGVINAYMLSQFPYEHILAFMGPTSSGGGVIAGGPGGGGNSSTGVIPSNIINSYLKAHDGMQTIYGYLHKDPYSITSILGYMAGGVSQNEIYGYLKGKEQPSGIIYGYASGVGYSNQISYAYLPSVSGIENTRIYGYANGALLIMDERDAIIIGMPSGTQECRSFGLMPENPGVIPTNTSPGLLF